VQRLAAIAEGLCNSIAEVEVDGIVAAAATELDSADTGAAAIAEGLCNSIAAVAVVGIAPAAAAAGSDFAEADAAAVEMNL
jgi:hypothetical protein